MSTRPSDLDGALGVRAFEQEDEPRVLEILLAAFGSWPEGVSDMTPGEFFRWKHVDGPFGPSRVLVVEADGAVIGLIAYMAWRFRARGELVNTLRGTDFAVDPAYHGRGVAFTLAQAAAKQFSPDLAFVWGNPGDQSVGVSVRAGWHNVGRVPRFIQPHGPLRGAIRRAYGGASRASMEVEAIAESAAEVLRDGPRASRLLALSEEPGERLATARDLDSLRWRYGRFEEYRAVRVEGTAGDDGIAIFRHRRNGPAWVLDICELLVAENDLRTARRLIQKVREAAPCDLLSCGFHSRRQAGMCGFVPAGHGGVLVTYPLHQGLVPDSTQLASWALSRGDLELL
jgi:predicted N-acetyltransferase YhbS